MQYPYILTILSLWLRFMSRNRRHFLSGKTTNLLIGLVMIPFGVFTSATRTCESLPEYTLPIRLSLQEFGGVFSSRTTTSMFSSATYNACGVPWGIHPSIVGKTVDRSLSFIRV